jgi:hypothetical protein
MEIGMVSIIYTVPVVSINIKLTRNFTLLNFWVSCGWNSDTKPDLIWAEYSVILLFFSKTMKKRPYLQVFAIRLSAVHVLNVGKYKTWTPGPWTPCLDRVHGPPPWTGSTDPRFLNGSIYEWMLTGILNTPEYK